MVAARLLDLTRTVSRAGRRPTGVDRVELAYLDRFLAEDIPAFGLIRTGLGHVLIGRSGLEALRAAQAARDWGPRDLLSRLSRRLYPDRQAALSLIRRHALGRTPHPGLARMIRRRLPMRGDYYNVGHSNLSEATLDGLSGWRKHVLIHDTIPLDLPDLQRPGTPEAFARRLRLALLRADRILCNSLQTEADLRRHAAALGLTPPPMVVASLGVTPVQPDPGALPAGIGGGVHFVTVGTIEPRKNHALLLDLWEKWEGPRPTLYICGSRGWANEAVFRRLDAGVPGVVECPGLSDGAIAALTAAARAMLFPSLAEGFGLPPMEAAALGVPVVCGDLAIWREVMGDWPVYLDPNDRYLWAKCVRQLAEAPEQMLKTPPLLPDWAGHFNKVLRTQC